MWILSQLPDDRETRSQPRWLVAAAAAIFLFGVVAAFGTVPDGMEIRNVQHTVVEQLLPTPEAASGSGNADDYFVREERIRRADTVSSLLMRLGVQDEQAFAFLRQQPETQAIFRQLRPGKVVTARTNAVGELLALTFPLNGPKDSALIVEKRNGWFTVSEQAQRFSVQLEMKSGEIRTSLFAETDAIGLPDSIATRMADIFGGDIDFHRDLRKGDRFSVVYEMLYDRGQPMRPGRILAAEFINNGKTFTAFWFEGKGGQGYYTAEGKNIRKAFLRSPLEFSRITSGFSHSRFHPIHRTWRAHKGVDYGAPMGTRIRATGDGIVEFAGTQAGYGNLVVLRHQGRYTTHYGHLSGFAPGIRKGVRVNQGDIIGYVGMSGWATGPHLHYEFRINGIHQNPLAISQPSAPPLSAEQLAEFKSSVEPLQLRLDRVRGMNLAFLE
jgi:murein DD-endopeptidase MepM/ murein hydrolase activator NlpD